MHILRVRKASGTPFTSSTLWSVKLPRFNWTCRAFLLWKTYVPSCSSVSPLCRGVAKPDRQEEGRQAGLNAGEIPAACCLEVEVGGPLSRCSKTPGVSLKSHIGNLGFPWTHPHTLSWEGWADFTRKETSTRVRVRRKGRYIHSFSQPTNEQVNKYMMWYQMLWRKMQ